MQTEYLPHPNLKRCRRCHVGAGLSVLIAWWTVAAPAANLTAQVVDTTGQAVADAVISLTPPTDARSAPAAPMIVSKPAVMDQWGKQFTPYVLPVQVGTRVLFPNRDNIKHQVYSFSPAKRLREQRRTPPRYYEGGEY